MGRYRCTALPRMNLPEAWLGQVPHPALGEIQQAVQAMLEFPS